MEEREANNRWMQGVATSLGFNTFVNDSLEEARARARQAEERAQHVERQLQEVLAKLGATQKPAGEPTPGSTVRTKLFGRYSAKIPPNDPGDLNWASGVPVPVRVSRAV